MLFFLLLFLLLKINQAQSKSKLCSFCLTPLLYLCQDLQQVAVYVLKSCNIPMMFVVKSKTKSYVFFAKKETIHMFFIPLKHSRSTVSLSSAWLGCTKKVEPVPADQRELQSVT